MRAGAGFAPARRFAHRGIAPETDRYPSRRRRHHAAETEPAGLEHALGEGDVAGDTFSRALFNVDAREFRDADTRGITTRRLRLPSVDPCRQLRGAES